MSNTTNTTAVVVPTAFVLSASVPTSDTGKQTFVNDAVLARTASGW